MYTYCGVVVYLCFALAFEALGQSRDASQMFYLQIQALEDNYTSVEECTSSKVCLREPGSRLSCMCGVEYEEAQALKAKCERNRTQLRVDELETPSALGFCASAFLRLGYSVSVVNISDSKGSVVNGYNLEQLSEKIEELKGYSKEFGQLLDMTIVRVYLRNELQRVACKDKYNEWLCTASLYLYMLSTADDKCQASCKDGLANVTLTNRTVVQLRLAKPCLKVCNRVVQQCPYYLPSKFQNQNQSLSEETIYGGYPVFDCPERSVLLHFEMNCKDCYQPYSLCDGDCCIGWGSARVRDLGAMYLTTIGLFLLCVFMNF